ncbi:MAG TPA: hypothetical protein VJ757_12355 [Pseudonocardiaceae bacterium]|nr:hypothetical protein [Pseudonocardiaceae bacterium]
MPDLHDVAELAAANGHLAVMSTIRADGTAQASLVTKQSLSRSSAG